MCGARMVFSMNAGEVYKAIRLRYSDARRYAIATEVGLSTGGSRRRLDVVVLDCYASNGFRIDGFEIKVSKADLRRELEDPDKHVAFFDRIDYYTLACPKGIADMSIIPPKWGVLEVGENGESGYKRRPLALHDELRKTVPRGFFAEVARALQGYSPSKEALDAEFERGLEKGREEERRHFALTKKRLEEDVTKLEEYDKIVSRFRLWGMNPGMNLDRFERFQELDLPWVMPRIKRLSEDLAKLHDDLGGLA